MDGEMLYSMLGIIGFIIVIILTVRKGNKKILEKSKEQKKDEIITQYKEKLAKALDNISNDKDLRIATKKALIKEYSNELSRNIFFNEDEVRKIILELSGI